MPLELVAMSDLHGYLPENVDALAGDVLVIAGDIMPDSAHRMWLRKHPGLGITWMKDQFIPWANSLLEYEIVDEVVFTWGNHDWTMETTQEIRKVLPPHVHLLVDEGWEYEGFTFWGSPWSNNFDGWSWMQEPEDLATVYANIPPCDVLISHQPPYGPAGMCPNYHSGRIEQLGSKELLAELHRINPQFLICGHIHEGHGLYTGPHGGTIANVSLLDERYDLRFRPTFNLILQREEVS